MLLRVAERAWNTIIARRQYEFGGSKSFCVFPLYIIKNAILILIVEG
jgi:hypothetical protein